MLALVTNTEVISSNIILGSWFTLPNGSRVTPAYAGWNNGNLRLANIVEADPVPEGKIVVATNVSLVNGQPKYVYTLEDEVTDLYDYAANRRWVKQNAGLAIGGSLIDTTTESLTLINGAYGWSKLNPDKLVRFKAKSGWVHLDAATVEIIANAVATFIQEMFDLEGQISDSIADGSITTKAEIDTLFE